jgi:Bacterial capsule synthesis protein PGA_cap
MPGRLARILPLGTILWVGALLVAVTTANSESVDSTQLRPATRLTPPARSFSLIATGDVLTESAVNAAAAGFAAGSGARLDFAPLFAPVSPMLASADIAICHMELPIGRPDERAGIYGSSPFGGNLLLAPYEIAAAMKRAGFDRCSTASNHSNDLAEVGIDTTLGALDSAGLSHVGTARTPAEAATTLLTINGIRLAHLSYTQYSNTVLPGEPWRINFVASPARVAADVDAARAAGAEVVVVSMHIYQELLLTPLAADRQFLTDLTARAHIDLVIEHGPHVVQPVEKVNGTWVYWSVGNFVSGMGTPSRGVFADPRTLDEIAAAARFTETAPGVFDVETRPVLLCNEPFTRAVYAAAAALADPSLSPFVRSAIQACMSRTFPIIPALQ